MAKQTATIGGGDKDKDSHNMERRGFKYNGYKKQVYNGQRLSVRNGGKLYWKPRPTPSSSARKEDEENKEEVKRT